MDKWLPVLATCVAGGLVAMQAPINSKLGKTVGTFPAASVSFAIGLLVLVSITVVFSGGFGQVAEARHLSWYYFLGGVLGASSPWRWRSTSSGSWAWSTAGSPCSA